LAAATGFSEGSKSTSAMVTTRDTLVEANGGVLCVTSRLRVGACVGVCAMAEARRGTRSVFSPAEIRVPVPEKNHMSI
jgi:hypothetical protein